MQLGVKHTVSPVDPALDFVHVLDSTELSDGVMKAAQANELPLLVTRFDGTTRAVSGVCTHRGGPLAYGEQVGHCVRCPWHGSRFSLDDGHVEEGPRYLLPLAGLRNAPRSPRGRGHRSHSLSGAQVRLTSRPAQCTLFVRIIGTPQSRRLADAPLRIPDTSAARHRH